MIGSFLRYDTQFSFLVMSQEATMGNVAKPVPFAVKT
jgi:hypothetical protein